MTSWVFPRADNCRPPEVSRARHRRAGCAFCAPRRRTDTYLQRMPHDARYLPIEDHGIIGDLNTVALVGLDGSIDFLCAPRFDAPSVFAALLDADRGGSFRIDAQLRDPRRKQLYLPDTNVLLTRALSPDEIGRA